MKHIPPAIMVVISIFLLLGINNQTVYAISLTPNQSFGGKVLLAPIPGVTCLGLGKVMMLSSNIAALVGAVASTASSDIDAKGKALNAVMALYKMVPTYTTNVLRSPFPTGQILGTESLIPDLTTCKIGAYPLPVYRTTDNYNVSR